MDLGFNPAPRLAGVGQAPRAPVAIELHESDGRLFLLDPRRGVAVDVSGLGGRFQPDCTGWQFGDWTEQTVPAGDERVYWRQRAGRWRSPAGENLRLVDDTLVGIYRGGRIERTGRPLSERARWYLGRSVEEEEGDV